jgi:penicillin-binding protein 2
MTPRGQRIFGFAGDSRTKVLKQRSRDIEDIGQSSTTLKSQDLWRRSGWVFAAMLLGTVGLLYRLSVLQSRANSGYLQRVDRNRIRREILPAPRGAIVDRNGIPVVQNVPNFVLSVIPADVPKGTDRPAWIARVQDQTKIALPDIEAALVYDENKSFNDPRILRDRISYNEALRLMVLIGDIPGLSVTAVPTRSYTLGPAFAPVLGYIGKITKEELRANPQASYLDETGKAGLEKQYNDILQGTDGYRDVEHDVFNRATNVLRRQDPIPGKTIRLTIDQQLQTRLYNSLSQAVSKAHSTGGAAIAVDPRNGEVLAMVSAPTFDNNWFIDESKKKERQNAVLDSRKLMLNRAIAGQYPSGSIIKPLISAAALAEKIITPTTTVLSTGGLKIGPNYFPDWKSGGHGVTNVAKAIAESVNTFYYEIGGGYENQPGLGVERIVKYLQLFGWGSKTGIDIPGEAKGFLPTKTWRDTIRIDPWRLGDTYHLAIGQGDVQATPIQIITSIAAVANGGTVYQPHLVQRVDLSDGTTGAVTQAKVLQKKFVSTSVLSAVQFGMRQGVLAGSSRSMQSLPVAVAGKTGTAQFGNKGKTHAWYTVYAPYENPTIAMIVLIEGGGEGNATALPVAKEVLQWYFTRGAKP